MALLLAACSTSDAAFDGEGQLIDHTADRLSTVNDYVALATSGAGDQSVAKFVIEDFAGESPDAHFLDSGFYTLHDEWYWYRLLNGVRVPSVDVEPVDVGRTFATIADVYSWAEVRDDSADGLPLDLRLSADDRLYSNEFYDTWALGAQRTLGLGSLVHLPARSEPTVTPEYWLFELEYADRSTVAEVERFFAALIADLPPEIATQLRWVTRSPSQVAVAAELAASGSPYADRSVAFSDIVPPGEATVYNPGIAAGRLLLVGADGASIEDAKADSIIMIEQVPDALPPANGLITATPQTPLAHVNLLARNRGIPNASLTGLLDDPELRQLARIQAPVVVRATAPDQLEIVPIDSADYRAWLALQTVDEVRVATVPTADLAYVEDVVALAAGSPTPDELARLRLTIGGKAMGMIALLQEPSVSTPPDVVALTTRSYTEHLAQIDDVLDTMFADELFRRSPAVRLLVLEGREDFDATYQSRADRELRDRFLAGHPTGSAIATVLESGGLRKHLRALPMDAPVLDAITEALTESFGHYAPYQGLRFRSSSTVEDIEGFNGAGLYTSNTGFLDPEAQLDNFESLKSIEWAVKKTWASYWSVEAFEEREREKIDHRSGAMAVLVHARFDDELERANGVATLTHRDGEGAVLEVNTQPGATSVANPTQDPTITPEVVTVTIAADGRSIEIDRVAASSLATSGRDVLSDAQLEALAAQTLAIATRWLDDANRGLIPSQAATSVTLDFEFRDMAAKWPAVAAGIDRFPERLVLKQVRTLDPGLRGLSAELRELPVPRDVLARAQRIVLQICQPHAGDLPVFEVHEVYTNPLISPDLGYATEPFRVLQAEIVPDTQGGYQLEDGSIQLDCQADILFSSPEEFLEGLLATNG